MGSSSSGRALFLWIPGFLKLQYDADIRYFDDFQCFKDGKHSNNKPFLLLTPLKDLEGL